MATDSSIKVLIADSRTFVRIGVQNVLIDSPDIAVVGAVATGAEVLTHIKQLRPDVVVIGEVDGLATVIDAIDKIGVQVLALADGPKPTLRRTAGLLLPDASPSELTAAIRILTAGYSLSLAGQQSSASDQKITARELDVLCLLARGYTNVEISRKLVLQESTVKSHVQSLFSKLCVRNRVSAVIYAYEKGFVRAGKNLSLVPPRSGSLYDASQVRKSQGIQRTAGMSARAL